MYLLVTIKDASKVSDAIAALVDFTLFDKK